MWVQIVLFIFGVFFLVGTVIYQVKTKKAIRSIDITANQPIIENDYRSEFTDGYTLGIVKTKILRKNGCYFIEFYPIDVEQGEDIARPHLQTFVVKQEFFKPLPKLSSRRIRIKTITRDPSKIPEEMKDTTEGKWVTKEGQLGYIKSIFGTAIQSGDEAIAEAMKEYARGEIPKAVLAKIKEEVRAKKDILENKEEEKPK